MSLFRKYVDINNWNKSQDRGGWQILLENNGLTPDDAIGIIDMAEEEYGGCVDSFLCNYKIQTRPGGTFEDVDIIPLAGGHLNELCEETFHGEGRPVKKGWFGW
ncbi:MAG: hypothetical protein AAF485_03540 [Chloroflexota bacterium]